MSTEPQSFSTVMYYEYKRMLESIEEASQYLVSPEEGEEPDVALIDRVKSIHAVVKMLSSFLWEDYILSDFGSMLTKYNIDHNNKMLQRSPFERSKIETYTAALRGMLNKTKHSFLAKVLLPSFELGEIQDRLSGSKELLTDTLKYMEAVTKWLETYMSWIEHGSKLAAAYTNGTNCDCGCNQYDHEEDEYDESDFYNDVRVKSYAFLKTTNLDPDKAVLFLQDINDLIMSLNTCVGIVHQAYSSMPVDGFEKSFMALISKKMGSKSYKGSKFEEVHELNEYIRQKVKHSMEYEDGFMYNTISLLEAAREYYIDKLATEITDMLVFIPDDDAQKKYIKSFETGRLWQRSLGQ